MTDPPSDQRARDAVFLSGFLAARDVPCPACGYNLRGLTTDRCPECSRDLLLTVSLAEPRLGAFIAGLVGLACGMGFDALLLVYFGWYCLVRQTPMPLWTILLSLTAPLVVLSPCLLLWIRARRRIGRLAWQTRWLLVAAAWSLTLGALVTFAMLIE